MDIFDILMSISDKKYELMLNGMMEKDASKRARFVVSQEYCIPLCDIRKICGA